MKRARPLAHILDGEEGWDASLPDQAPPSQPLPWFCCALMLALLAASSHGQDCFNAYMPVQSCVHKQGVKLYHCPAIACLHGAFGTAKSKLPDARH